MELFAYNRYLGEDESKKTSCSNNNLENLLKKVKARRLRADTATDSPKITEEIDISTFSNSLNCQSSLKQVELIEGKFKNAEKEQTGAPDLVFENCTQSFQVKPEKNKKKKKKGPALSGSNKEIPDHSNENSFTNEPVKKAKVKVKQDLDLNSLNISKKLSKLSVNTAPVKQSVYTVLGDHEFRTKRKVKRVLPKWLSSPIIISSSLTEQSETHNSRAELGNVKLSCKLVRKLQENGINRLFPVQTAVIPYQINRLNRVHFLLPRDLCVCAPTGSGKTLAYVLPLLHLEMQLKCSLLHGLVIVPVQELAVQVFKVFQMYSEGTNVTVGLTCGGNSLEKESASLIRKRTDGSFASIVDVLVSTPGRLTDHLVRTKGFTVKHLRWLVVDEADRLMEQRDLTWLRLIEEQCDPLHKGITPPISFQNLQTMERPQKLLFSATLSQDPEKLLLFNLFQPMLITTGQKSDEGHFLGKFTTPNELEESYVECEVQDKLAVVAALVKEHNSLVFTKSCIEADRLAHVIRTLTGRRVVHLSTEVPPSKRTVILKNWEAGRYDVIVASDRLARGMDLPSVDQVVLCDPPKFIKGYIHRVGRTGRGGRRGQSFTLLTQPQLEPFLKLLSAAGKPSPTHFSIDPSTLQTFTKLLPSALSALESYLQKKSLEQNNRVKAEKRKKSIKKFKPMKKFIKS